MTRLMRFIALCAALLAAPAWADTTVGVITDRLWQPMRGTTNVGTPVATEAACWAALRAWSETNKASITTARCRNEKTATVTYTAPPPCPPAPPNETRTQTCPAGTTGAWTQVRAYNAAPQPTCWVAGEWLPTTAPTGSCVAPPPPPPTGSVSAWPDTATPTIIADTDTAAVELGVKFRVSVAGAVSAVRFYRSSANAARIVRVWSATGAKLGEAAVPAGAAVGWVTVALPAAVPVQANTTYVASYHAPAGRYSADNNGLAAARVNGPLTMLASGTDGGNGVYLYGAGGFPTQTYQASNYWVDVVFTPGGEPPPPPPATGTAALTWDPATDPVVTGWRVYWGTASRTYAQPIGTGVLVTGSPTYTVTGLPAGTHFFAVTAVAADGRESAYSNEASKTIAP